MYKRVSIKYSLRKPLKTDYHRVSDIAYFLNLKPIYYISRKMILSERG